MSYIRLAEQGTPTTFPPTGKVFVYAKSDGLMYSMDDAGVETQMTNGATINTFATFATPAGTSPVADTAADTLTLTSTGGSVTITGNAATDTVNFEVASPTQSFVTIAVPSGTNPVADSVADTLTLTAGAGLTITGTAASDTIDFSPTTNLKAESFGITIDGGGSTITTGVKGYITIPYSMTITGWDIVADQVGSIVIDVWKDTFANFPPVLADTIAGSEKPTLSTQNHAQDLTLTTWTTTVTTGDIVGFNVDSATTVTRVTLVIRGVKT